MLKFAKIRFSTTSTKLYATIVGETLLLLFISLAVMLYFSREALMDEAKHDVELTLEGTMEHIDNVLMSVERSTYNIYMDLQAHLDKPERMLTYSQKIVETNPLVVGCAIVFRPGYYPGKDLYMAYMHRKGGSTSVDEGLGTTEIECLQRFTDRPYTEQIWYTEPMEKLEACWVGPLKNEDAEDEALITFCLPIFDKGECVGVVATDMAIEQLTEIILSVKPTPNSYSVLLNSKGSFIVHPDEKKLTRETVFNQLKYNAEPSVKEAANAMLSGQTGYAPFHLDNKDWYVFYRPFDREVSCGQPMEKLGWSAGLVYLEDDYLGSYNFLLYMVLAITILGILVFLVLFRLFIHRQTKPLRMLTRYAQRIAEGNYDITVPNAQNADEIGKLQDHFQKMQQSLAAKAAELEQLTKRLKQRNEDLRKAYSQAQGSDRMKATFLHYMTTQMAEPANRIEKSVIKLVNNFSDITPQEAGYERDVIKEQSDAMLDLLEHMIEALKIEAEEAEKVFEKGKETADE